MSYSAAGAPGPQGPPPPVFVRTVATRQGDVALAVGDVAGALSVTAGNASYARLRGAKPSNRVVALGDSITQGGDDLLGFARATSFLTWASILSGGQIEYIRNAGIGGNRTGQMLARYDTDVTAYNPDTVIILAGTNDADNTDYTTWVGQYTQLIALARSRGHVPVIGVIPPTNSVAPGSQQRYARIRMFQRAFAHREGLALLDFYTLLADPTTGAYKAGVFADGTHPNALGYYQMGQYVAQELAFILPRGNAPLCAADGDENNIISNGTFASATGTAIPAGWSDQSGTPAGSAISYTTDAAVPGKLFTITQTATTGGRQAGPTLYFGSTALTNAQNAGDTSVVLPVRADFGGVLYIGTPGAANYEVVKILSSAGGGPQTETLVRGLQFAHAAGETVVINGLIGDEFILSGLVTSDGGVAATAKTIISGGPNSPIPMSGLVGAITRGVFHQRFTLQVGTTSPLSIGFGAGIGTGVVSFGRLGLYNATRMQLL